jgi:transcriptional regulator with XRE-family HTH domain
MKITSEFGEEIKRLRELNRLYQRQVASELQIDSPMLSKIERGERMAKKDQVEVLAKLYKTDKEQLMALWLADQLYEIVKDEKVATDALKFAEKKVKLIRARR